MSELKATRIKMVYDGEIYEDLGTAPYTQLYYRKEEVDKVITELKDKALQYKVLNKEHCRDLNTQEQFFAEQIAHQKYKRCLTMANYWGLVSACTRREIQLKCMRRELKWRKLAEKFKEAK